MLNLPVYLRTVRIHGDAKHDCGCCCQTHAQKVNLKTVHGLRFEIAFGGPGSSSGSSGVLSV